MRGTEDYLMAADEKLGERDEDHSGDDAAESRAIAQVRHGEGSHYRSGQLRPSPRYPARFAARQCPIP